MFALVDANAFYCSAEQVFRPDWRGKPVIVLSNNDGCVVAANRQARELGVEKFKPFFQMRTLCEMKGVIVCSSNYELYGDLSEKMMQVIGRFAPEQHVYSIDESFLSFHRCAAIPDLRVHAESLRRAVWKECRLAVGVGMGETLTLAKAANHAAKKLSGYAGVCVLDSEAERLDVLGHMAVGDVWGVGRRISERLKRQGIETALQLSRQKPALMRREFNVEMERTVRELNGEVCKGWDVARADKQQIFSTRSMGERIVEQEALHQALCKHAGIAAAKLRAQGSVCSVLMVFAGNSPYDEKPRSFKQLHRFAFPVDDTTVITSAVSALVPLLYELGVQYYKVGVGLLDLARAEHVQPDLFDTQPGDPALMKAFDGLNQRYGTGTVFLAAEGIAPKWGMRREYLSPQYTTRWGDVPRVRC
ncbi:Error-prone, lesion bypass DNA polymerase V (UmuC) [Grimontia indica]|uniref:Error-prone, lesion bypass DNA polymerase V (UmuC) n=1 Tax=Grimontia indica TaxID=1056512 RepID=R1IYC7_9GAMM|nr:Y-family DNA polymerase [Grimontia indica]EOD80335.1 Error-prone, lesion bypass DNA polymerase V (UmuC) [Grimontia indica]